MIGGSEPRLADGRHEGVLPLCSKRKHAEIVGNKSRAGCVDVSVLRAQNSMNFDPRTLVYAGCCLESKHA